MNKHVPFLLAALFMMCAGPICADTDDGAGPMESVKYGAPEPAPAPVGMGEAFIGNSKTRKVHRPDCGVGQRTSDENRVNFATYEKAVEAGFTPCRICDPDKVSLEAKTAFKGSREEAEAKAPFVGNRDTQKVHRRSCTHAKSILDDTKVYFASYADAIEAGYIPCRTCDPDRATPEEAIASHPPPEEEAVTAAPLEKEAAASPAIVASVPAAGSAQAAKAPSGPEEFIGNKHSRKLHHKSCRYGKKTAEQNRVYFSSYGEAKDLGFIPCKVCRPDLLAGEGAAMPALAGPGGSRFVGNIKSKKLHLATCRYAIMMSDAKKAPFDDFQKAIDSGYVPCKVCHPERTGGAWTPAQAVVSTAPARTEPAASAREAPPARLAPFVGNNNTHKVHRGECRLARRIADKNRITFENYGDAADAGFLPCGVCRPDRKEVAAARPAGAEKPRPAAAKRASAKPSPRRAVRYRGGEKSGAPEKKAATPAPPAGYVASRNGKTFHRADCPWARHIRRRYRVTYAEREEAVAAGKLPCRICNP